MDITKMNIKEIASLVNKNDNVSPDLIRELEKDGRKGVFKILNTLAAKKERQHRERERIMKMLSFEKELWQAGYLKIAGVDEVGRGPLAGPVVAAAVVLPQNCYIAELNDSKKLKSGLRKKLFAIIKEKALFYSIGVCSVREIDEQNIYQASLRAMAKAVNGLPDTPDYLLVDGFPIPGLKLPQKPIVRGDSLSLSIAAASVVAKVYRDDLMVTLANKYPGYGFEKHKGYPTKDHRRALQQLGASEIHRRSFNLFADNGEKDDS